MPYQRFSYSTSYSELSFLKVNDDFDVYVCFAEQVKFELNFELHFGMLDFSMTLESKWLVGNKLIEALYWLSAYVSFDVQGGLAFLLLSYTLLKTVESREHSLECWISR